MRGIENTERTIMDISGGGLKQQAYRIKMRAEDRRKGKRR